MTPKQYRQALEKLGLSIIGAAPVFGISKRQAQRFAGGEVEIPKLVCTVLNLALKGRITMEDLQ